MGYLQLVSPSLRIPAVFSAMNIDGLCMPLISRTNSHMYVLVKFSRSSLYCKQVKIGMIHLFILHTHRICN